MSAAFLFLAVGAALSGSVTAQACGEYPQDCFVCSACARYRDACTSVTDASERLTEMRRCVHLPNKWSQVQLHFGLLSLGTSTTWIIDPH